MGLAVELFRICTIRREVDGVGLTTMKPAFLMFEEQGNDNQKESPLTDRTVSDLQVHATFFTNVFSLCSS